MCRCVFCSFIAIFYVLLLYFFYFCIFIFHIYVLFVSSFSSENYTGTKLWYSNTIMKILRNSVKCLMCLKMMKLKVVFFFFFFCSCFFNPVTFIDVWKIREVCFYVVVVVVFLLFPNEWRHVDLSSGSALQGVVSQRLSSSGAQQQLGQPGTGTQAWHGCTIILLSGWR